MKHVGFMIEENGRFLEIVGVAGRLTDADKEAGFSETPVYVDDGPQTFEQVIAERELLRLSQSALLLEIARLRSLSKSRLEKLRKERRLLGECRAHVYAGKTRKLKNV